jgi:hypothetical protein
MRKILKAFPIIAPALSLAFLMPGPAAADDDDDDGGYYRKQSYHQIGHRRHYGHYGYGHHGYGHHGYHGRHYVSRHVYVAPKMVYVAPKPVYREDYRWRQPPPKYVTTRQGQGEKIYYEEPTPQGPASTCLMTREYQTQVVVGGRAVPGYGYACLQPDGSWYRGPAVPIERR